MVKDAAIGIIGHTGMVGSQVYNYFNIKYNTIGISLDEDGKTIGSWKELNRISDLIFVCVPTPFDFDKNKANLKIVEEVLTKIAPRKTVVIKSTVWPGTTEKMQKRHPKLNILFNPEFLSRITAKKDFEKPDRQLVGYTEKSKTKAKEILNLLPKGKYNKTMLATEAELIKYSHNVFGATQIMYANHLYEVCEKLGINYDEVKKGFAASEFIGEGILRYMNIFHNNKRGYGGPCFPKDVNSYVQFCAKIGVKAELPKATRKANRRILAEQGLTEKKAEKL